MEHLECDFSPLKKDLKEQLTDILHSIGQVVSSLDEVNTCLLNEIEHISKWFSKTGALASTYYLNCFLSPYTSKYKEISRSVNHLSLKRQGALIVIQREDSIDSWITPGILLSAEITSSLLESIFVPGSPLHDGAVFIRSNQIVSAANILPLTERTFPNQKLGTRHRAAIGLSERTDALIIVVSEETGKTSFCLNGHLYPFSIPSPV
ncbi:sporulation-specific diadenylate cyclase CdaS [Paenibacillus tyrfis]|uniref:sporulation-specific diadenylate cyclase CdaS n=1 Tax=Paenibacillus tyrfis TaxID=1501230 RepID=UPI0020A22F4F|nr:sporulation-specific diadenylate cyclase CdaS [Paenibacillus tyrfis]MCP1310734.1 sporulation-specific diadenylate cyclase CdaS [Paenibacillus tyrfis]